MMGAKMEIIRSWEEEGITTPSPCKRHIKVVLAKDRRNVSEITFSYVYIEPGNRTDYHDHDRPELIMVLSGQGKSVCDGIEIPIEPDMALWVRAGERHQVVNDGGQTLKLATVFTPAYEAGELIGGITAHAPGRSADDRSR
jgi:mannose-6-phosphate isomerase-like protein (cupin superfamily)